MLEKPKLANLHPDVGGDKINPENKIEKGFFMELYDIDVFNGYSEEQIKTLIEDIRFAREHAIKP